MTAALASLQIASHGQAAMPWCFCAGLETPGEIPGSVKGLGL